MHVLLGFHENNRRETKEKAFSEKGKNKFGNFENERENEYVYTLYVYTLYVYTLNVYTLYVYTLYVYTLYVYTLYV